MLERTGVSVLALMLPGPVVIAPNRMLSMIDRIILPPNVNRANHQNSDRYARPEKVTYFEKQVLTAVMKSMGHSLSQLVTWLPSL